MRVALTGATGFLGLHLGAALVEAGHHVTALVRDPKRLGALEALVNTRQIALEDHAALVATLADHDALHNFRAGADKAMVLDDGGAGLQRLQHAPMPTPPDRCTFLPICAHEPTVAQASTIEPVST